MRFDIKQYQEEGAEFQMAPMIDIFFLLLIFFMLISNLHLIERGEGINLPLADQSETITDTYSQITLAVMDNGTIIFNQQVLDASELVDILSSQPAEIKKVLIRGDRNVPHGRIQELMRACAKSNIWNVSFAALQEEVER